MAGAENNENIVENNSLWTFLKFYGQNGRAINRIKRCFNDSFDYDNIHIYSRFSHSGGFFINICNKEDDGSLRKLAHISFHKRVGKGQTHFKFEGDETSYDISIQKSGNNFEIMSYDDNVNRFLDNIVENGLTYREAINRAIKWTYNNCVKNKNIRTPGKSGVSGTAVKPGRKSVGYRGNGRRLFGSGKNKINKNKNRTKSKGKSKARMTKIKKTVKGVVRNVRISKTGRKYVLLHRKRHYL